MRLGTASGGLLPQHHPKHEGGIYLTKIPSRSNSCSAIDLGSHSNTILVFLTLFSNPNVYRNNQMSLSLESAGYFTLYKSAFTENPASAWVRYWSLTREPNILMETSFFGEIDQN